MMEIAVVNYRKEVEKGALFLPNYIILIRMSKFKILPNIILRQLSS